MNRNIQCFFLSIMHKKVFLNLLFLGIFGFRGTSSVENSINKFTVACTSSDSDQQTSEIKKLQQQITDIQKTVENDRCAPANSRKNSVAATYPRNCKEVQERGYNLSNVYLIQPIFAPEPFLVFCDMKTKGGGWTYLVNRYKGQVNFDLNWNDYKEGFGNLADEFWLGLENIHYLTGYEVNEVFFELVGWDLQKNYTHCDAFGIRNETEGFAVNLMGSCTGFAATAFYFLQGMKFSTKDRDQDLWSENCAALPDAGGGWWFDKCSFCPLASEYKTNSTDRGKNGIHCSLTFLKQARMMVRPRSNKEKGIYLLHDLIKYVSA